MLEYFPDKITGLILYQRVQLYPGHPVEEVHDELGQVLPIFERLPDEVLQGHLFAPEDLLG